MNLLWIAQAWADYLEWHARDPKIWLRINELVRDVQRTPYSGLGKPEPLRGQFTGYWSRRIDEKHRLIYRVIGKAGEDQRVQIIQCKNHY